VSVLTSQYSYFFLDCSLSPLKSFHMIASLSNVMVLVACHIVFMSQRSILG